jgi:hypothetical protein
MKPVREPTYDAGRNYVGVSGKLLNELLSAIRARTPIAGANVRLEELATGFLIHASGGGGGSALGGAFYTQYESDGDTFLQGGQIIAGEGGADLDDYKVLVGGVLPSGVVAGSRLWIEVDVDAITDEDNEIIISGLNVTGASYDVGASLPENEFPGLTTGGKIILEVGRWTAESFTPSGSGSFVVSGATGTFRITRL